jgi:hypothetical protein
MSGTSVLTARERDGVPINIRPAFNDMGTGHSRRWGSSPLRHRI